jgi:sugar lactone lactonase YvrE
MKKRTTLIATLAHALLLSACSSGSSDSGPARLNVIDLDPTSAGVTMQFESITADAAGKLYVADRINLGVLRVDPKAPPAVKVATLASRQINGTDTKPDASGMVFDGQGGLLIGSAPFSEILRIPAASLNAASPGMAQTYATGVGGANGLLLDAQGRLYVAGGASGSIYRVPAGGGAGALIAQIEPYTRAVPPDGFMQNVVANGLAFVAGALFVSDTARGAIWQVAIPDEGAISTPVLLVQDPLLEGIDGLAVDGTGTLWGAVNEQNAIVTVSATGNVHRVYKNDSKGPFEYPAAIVFVGDTGYAINLDRARRDNFAADGMTSLDGVGASIVEIPDPHASPSMPSISDSSGY